MHKQKHGPRNILSWLPRVALKEETTPRVVARLLSPLKKLQHVAVLSTYPPGSSIISHAKYMTAHILQEYMLNSTIDPFIVPARHSRSSKSLFHLHLFRGSHATHEENNDVRTEYDEMTRFLA
jgi:hypothetical protein